MTKQSTLNRKPLSPSALKSLETMANRLRRHSLLSTSEAGSGHPSSCFSCAEIVATVFFHFLRYDLENPKNPHSDRFVLSKGHAAPVLWAALAEAGAFPVEDLMTLRRIDSELEGHPTPRSRFVDLATGSLGQGLSCGLGMAVASRMSGTDSRVYVLLGDGEAAEGAVWEAAELASHEELDNLTAIIDVNRLGQSDPTMFGHRVDQFQRRFEAFGWNTAVIDGHNISELIDAFHSVSEVNGKPGIIIARTLKGKGVSFMEDADGWHGKPITDDDQIQQALREIGDDLSLDQKLVLARPEKSEPGETSDPVQPLPPPSYGDEDKVATRQAFGAALQKLGELNHQIVALDGDVKNSTYSEAFAEKFPARFLECFIAEQNMVGAAAGMAALGKIPFASTFACFLSRAYDFIRMAGISQVNLKLCGSHAGVSIGEDGPSQMGLEDIAMMRAISGSTVLYPSDAVSAERAVELAARTPGIVYIRTTRPKTPILYAADEPFEVGGCKVLRGSDQDQVSVVAAGITLHEALSAYDTLSKENILVRVIDLYSVKPIDEATLKNAAKETGHILVVEDHYPEGGLGEAVLSALNDTPCDFHHLAVNDLPRSGDAKALMKNFGICADDIVHTVRQMVSEH